MGDQFSGIGFLALAILGILLQNFYDGSLVSELFVTNEDEK